MDETTIEYYDRNAEAFCRSTREADMSDCRSRFLKYLPEGAQILDAGCGSGRDAKAFREAGYRVTAMDASAGICREAGRLLGQEVLCLSFEQMEFEAQFDGIWACASLLHVPEEQMEEVFRRLGRALRDPGILYVSFKYGTRERRSEGRLFNDCDEEKLCSRLENQDFRILELFVTQDVREERRSEKWINAVAAKSGKEMPVFPRERSVPRSFS